MANATSEMRRSVDQTTEQAKQGFDQFMGSAQQATDTVQRNARNIGQKVLTFTERNICATLQLGQRVLQAKDVSEIVKLQTEYANAFRRSLNNRKNWPRLRPRPLLRQ